MGILRRSPEVPETEIHELLRNERRQQVIEQLQQTIGSISLRELSEAIAANETGTSPPPTNIRQSVYNSLHQTHLPKLDERGIITYDADRKTICLNDEARALERYMTVVTPYGFTWSEFYRALGTGSLFVVLASLLEFPLVSLVDPVLWASLFLCAFTVAIGSQLWRQRWVYLNALLG